MSTSASRPAALDIEPAFEGFARDYAAGKPQVVWTRLVADLETAVSAYLKIGYGKPMSFLLESVEGGATRARYSIIGLEPDLIWRANGQVAEINRAPGTRSGSFKPEKLATLDSLRGLLEESRIEMPDGLPPMAAGVFGYMGYDTVRLVERLPDVPPDALGVPDMLLMRPTVIVIFDSVKDEMTLVTPVRPVARQSAEKAFAAARKRLAAIVQALEGPLPAIDDTTLSDEQPEPVSNTSAAEFVAMVDKAKAYIRAGDAFQIVLSQRFSAPFELPAFSLYRALRRLNPSPFLFHLEMDGFALVGSSPEILVRVRSGEVTIRPLAGTRPRGATTAQDHALAAPKKWPFR